MSGRVVQRERFYFGLAKLQVPMREPQLPTERDTRKIAIDQDAGDRGPFLTRQ